MLEDINYEHVSLLRYGITVAKCLLRGQSEICVIKKTLYLTVSGKTGEGRTTYIVSATEMALFGKLS